MAKRSERIRASWTVRDIMKRHPGTRAVFEKHGMGSCGGPEGPTETIRFFASVHTIPEDEFIKKLEEHRDLPLDEARRRLGVKPQAARPPDKDLLRKLFGV